MSRFSFFTCCTYSVHSEIEYLKIQRARRALARRRISKVRLFTYGEGGETVYSVLIAEDEILVRMGLTVSVPWEQLDMVVVQDVGNGQEAWEAYQRPVSYTHLIILCSFLPLKMPKRQSVSIHRTARIPRCTFQSSDSMYESGYC